MEPRLGLLGDVMDELRWTFGSRKGWLVGMAGNLILALVVVAYQDYDPHAPGDIKAANVGLAVVLWCLADTVNTNQLGSDSERAVNSLEAGDSLRRILAIKNLALVVLLVPVAFAISIVHRIMADRWHFLLHTAIFDLGAVVLWMGVGSVVSVLLPYRPISLRARLAARKTWLRWGICQGATYAAFGLVIALHLPFYELWHNRVFGGHVRNFDTYAFVYLGIAFAYWGLGLWAAAAYERRFPQRLIRDLQRPD